MTTHHHIEPVVRLGFYGEDATFVPVCDTRDEELARIVAEDALERWDSLRERWTGTPREVVYRAQAERLREVFNELGLSDCAGPRDERNTV